MRDKLTNGCIRKFIEDYECVKRINGEPCRMNGGELLKIIKANDFENILKQIKNYEDDWQKFTIIETKILSTYTADNFFESLLPEIKKTFEIPYIWLTLIEETSLAGLVKYAALEKDIEKEIAFISAANFEDFFKNGPKPLIAEKYTSPYNLFFPKNHNFSVRSMAIVPFYVDGVVIGSLNFGHFVSNRFVPDMDTSLLQQIMIKLSLSLSRIVAIEKLKYLDCHDSWTGLLNRSALMTELQKEFGRSLRHNKDLSVVFIDIDGFKGLNDMYGHDYGDMAIQYVVETIKTRCRTEDTLARITGDEFAIILPESRGDMSEFLVKRIQTYLDEHPFDYRGVRFHLSLNCAIASIDEDGIINADQMLKIAYNRLNDAKTPHHQDKQITQKGSVYKFRAS